MKIIPAIDLQNGKCVRLFKGDFTQAKVYAENPLKIAEKFQAQGIHYLHIVDLDGAKAGKSMQQAIVAKIVKKTELEIQFGGGIRDAATLDILFNCGIKRVVVGSVAVKHPELVMQWLLNYGADKFVLALDVLYQEDYYLVTQGWQQQSNKTLWELLDFYQQFFTLRILCTDVSRDGTLTGPNLELYAICLERFPQFNFQASGGVRNNADILALTKLNIQEVIVGKAIYEGKIKL